MKAYLAFICFLRGCPPPTYAPRGHLAGVIMVAVICSVFSERANAEFANSITDQERQAS